MQLTVFGIAALLGTLDPIVANLPAEAQFCIGCTEDEVNTGDITNDAGEAIIEAPTDSDDINPGESVGDIANNTGPPVTNDAGQDIIEAPTEPDDINPGDTIE